MSQTDDKQPAPSAAEVLAAAADAVGRAGSQKEAVLARIRARRGRLAQAADVAEAEAALAELKRRAEAQERAASPASVPESGFVPLEPGVAVLEPAPAPRPRRAREGAFPRSLTLRLALRHPGLLALGVGLIWKVGPTRLLLLSRLVVPLLRK
ncbi:MAG: hypothetical protein QM617_15595 [Comamonas sp.]